MHVYYIYIHNFISLYLKVCMYILINSYQFSTASCWKDSKDSQINHHVHHICTYSFFDISSSSSPQGNARSIDLWSNTDGYVYDPTNYIEERQLRSGQLHPTHLHFFRTSKNPNWPSQYQNEKKKLPPPPTKKKHIALKSQYPGAFGS